MTRLSTLVSGALTHRMVVLLAVMCAVLALWAPGFATSGNVDSMLQDLSLIGLVALGELFVLLAGGLDLSVGSSVLVGGVIADDLLRFGHQSAAVTIILVIAAGAIIGAINGLAITLLSVPPFIVTLAALYALRGVGLLLYHTDVTGSSLSDTLITSQSFINLGTANVAGVPLSFVILAVLTALGIFILRRTRFGAHLYAIGGNELAVRLSRVHVNRLTVQTYMLSGALATFAGAILTARLQTGAPTAGLGLEFDAIGAVVIGGASLFGGRGTAVGTLLGAAFVTILAKGQLLLGVAANYQNLTKGLVILFAVFLNEVTRTNARQKVLRRGDMPSLEESLGDARTEESSPHPTQAFEGSSAVTSTARGPAEHVGSAVLTAKGLQKSFGEVHALDDVTLELRPGEIHALVGENGAGKSTLIKILSGVLVADWGEIEFLDETITASGVAERQDLGVATVYQERATVTSLSVADNILLGREPCGRIPGVINRSLLNSRAFDILKQLGSPINPQERAGDLSVALQQLVDVARALSFDASVLLLDEPTATLTATEKDRLFAVMRTLRDQGTAILFISHNLEEVFEVADYVTVLRDGRVTQPAISPVELTRADLIRFMIGREIDEDANRAREVSHDVVLRVDGLRIDGVLDDISFSVHRGEVLGIAGLVGAGRTELMRAISGADPFSSGQITMQGKPLRPRSPRDTRRVGIGFVPEDRKRDGLVASMSISENISLPNYDAISRFGGWIDHRRERDLAKRMVSSLNVQPPGVRRLVRHLSGGNQQKVVLGKWLARSPALLLIDEPTQGVDVGAKEEIYRLIDDLATSGVSIVMVSSYLPEVLRMSDRVLVMREGQMVLDTLRTDASEERILSAAAGDST